MRDEPSKTAAWVALARSLGAKLPAAAHIAVDPYGAQFTRSRLAAIAARSPSALTVPAWPFVLYMQVRTRAIDDALLEFVRRVPGGQVMLLGAGYDCRAARFSHALSGVSFFEVDHPRTQARKREVLASSGAASNVIYVPWDFEAQPVEGLPRALAEVGHDPRRPTLTIWEGVTMYLSEAAIAASVAAVSAISSPGSQFVVSYFDKVELARPGLDRRVVASVVRGAGEPFRFGWHPHELPSWFEPHGFEVERDDSTMDLAAKLLPPTFARAVRTPHQRIAILRRR